MFTLCFLQVVGETSFVSQIVQMSVAALKNSREMVARTGHSLVLGCLHRYVGGMGSGQHLQMSVSVLQGLVEDSSTPVIQVSFILLSGLIILLHFFPSFLLLFL